MSADTSYPAVVPMLHYEDVAAALDWLSRVCGFSERMRLDNEDGSVSLAEVEVPGGGLVMVTGPYEDLQSPRTLGGSTVLMYIMVDSVDAHHARAREAGGEVTEQPADQPYGHRRYSLLDPEGHHWAFAQVLAG